MLTRSQFAEAAHVSKPAVTKAVTAGRLVLTANDKLDTYDPLNARFLDEHEPSGSPKPRKPHTLKDDTVSPPTTEVGTSSDSAAEKDDDEGDSGGVVLNGLKTRLDLAELSVKQNNAERLSIGNAQKLEDLVVRDRMRQRIGILGGEVRTRFLTLPSRLSSTIHAMILSLLDPDSLASQIADALSAGGAATDVAAIIRAQLGNVNPKKIRDLCTDEVNKALKGAKEAAARADLDSFDPSE